MDVMDGHFVPNLTMGPAIVSAVRRSTRLPLDAHLMVEEPERFMVPFVNAGADRLTIHVELGRTRGLLPRIRRAGALSGLSLNPETPARSVFPFLGEVGLVLVMTVHPGFGGQGFMASVVPKIRAIRREISRRGLRTLVEVDGGVSPRTAGRVVAAGADVLVAGDALFRDGRIARNLPALRRAAR